MNTELGESVKRVFDFFWKGFKIFHSAVMVKICKAMHIPTWLGYVIISLIALLYEAFNKKDVKVLMPFVGIAICVGFCLLLAYGINAIVFSIYKKKF